MNMIFLLQQQIKVKFIILILLKIKEIYTEKTLKDKLVDSDKEEESITFAEGFGIITDLDISPYNGYLYVVSSIKGDSGGSIYKIMPK